MVSLAADVRAASETALPPTQSAAPVAEATAGTRVNTARLLSAALLDAAISVAREARLPPPPTSLAMPLAVLWSRTHKFDAADAGWPDRDRCVLSAAAATPLLYALLRLSGHPGMQPHDLDHLSETGRLAALAYHPAIEAIAAPGGQTLAIAVGMALAERALATRFGKSLVDHRVWAVADAAELTQGAVQEAAALAGQLRLDRLVLLTDAAAPTADDPRARFASMGWAVKSACSGQPDDIEAALSFALRSRKPTLLWCAPSPDLAPVSNRATPNALEAWRRVGARGSVARRAWLKRIARHPQRAEFERVQAARLPDCLHDLLTALRQQLKASPLPIAPAQLCRQIIDRLMTGVPELLIGQTSPMLATDFGSASPAPSAPCTARVIACQNRAQAVVACATGLALHGGALPLTAASLADVMEQMPALRLAALHRRRSIHLAFEPASNASPAAWRAFEVLPWLRAIPDLQVFRPSCAVETVECFELALRRADGPSLLVLSTAISPPLRRDLGENRCARGGYVLAEADGARRATLIASGAEIVPALRARALLAADGVATAVISLPCWSLFAVQDEAFRRVVLGAVPRFAVEAAGRSGWDRWLNDTGGFIGSEEALSPELIAQTVRRRLVQT